jgi:Fe2+ or Zn2+ uptake regulation protein
MKTECEKTDTLHTNPDTPVSDKTAETAKRRPTPERVAAIVGYLKPGGAVVTVPVLVSAIRRETGCSRATAYRAVSDAFAAGEIESSND